MNKNKEKESFKQKTQKLGIAIAKVYFGVGTTNDWITIIKFAIPCLIAQFILILGFWTVVISVVFGPIDMVQQKLNDIKTGTTQFLEKMGNWFHGNGFTDSETAYINIVTKNKDLGCKKSSLVTATLMYYYQSYDEEMNWGDPNNSEYEEVTTEQRTNSETGETETETTTSEINYGELLPDLKRLSAKIKSGEENYEKYVKNKFLEQSPYNKLLEGYNGSDREKRKNEVYEEIKGIATEIPCSDSKYSADSGVCTYTSSKGIVATDLKVRLLSCGNTGLPSSPMVDEGLIDLETYITGVVYQEVGGSSDEVIKAQVVIARNYLLSRNSVMGGIYGAIEEIDGQSIVSIRACTGDQAFCHPDKGCYSHVCGGEYNWGKRAGVDASFHSGYSPDVLLVCTKEEANNNKKFGKPPLAPDSKIRTLVKETLGEYAVDENGKAVYLSFMDKEQKNWGEMANKGMSYKDIIKESYPNVSDIVSDCTYVGTGQIRYPLDEGTYRVTSMYGNRPSPFGNGTHTNHSGIDFGAPLGTPIYAVAPGVVEYAGFNTGGYGNLVVLAHDLDGDGENDVFTMYAHQSEILVQKDTIVTGGQVIGKVGSTGNSTGAHLHFEMRWGKVYSEAKRGDPWDHLEAIKSGTSIFNQMIRSQEKYYNQGDYSSTEYCPGMSGETIKNNGCLPTSVAMVVAYLKDSTVTPPDVANNICTNYSSYRVQGSGTNSEILNDSKFLSNYHIRSTKINSDYENQIKSALKLNKAIIVNVRGGTFDPNNSGHYFVLLNSNKEGTVKVLDPGSRERTKEYPISSITANISNGIWIFE